MAKKTKKPSRLAKELVETAAGMRQAYLLDRTTYDKITLRHPASNALPGSHRRPPSKSG